MERASEHQAHLLLVRGNQNCAQFVDTQRPPAVVRNAVKSRQNHSGLPIEGDVNARAALAWKFAAVIRNRGARRTHCRREAGDDWCGRRRGDCEGLGASRRALWRRHCDWSGGGAARNSATTWLAMAEVILADVPLKLRESRFAVGPKAVHKSLLFFAHSRASLWLSMSYQHRDRGLVLQPNAPAYVLISHHNEIPRGAPGHYR
jgi:hypothetical protein